MRPPPLPNAGRRRHPRVELFAQVQWKQGSEVYILRVANASLGGLLLESARGELPALEREATLDLALFTEADTIGDPILLKAKVVRTEDRRTDPFVRIGVEIVSIEASSETRFKALLRTRMP